MKKALSIIFAIIISAGCLYLENKPKKQNNPIEAYRVYVEGNDIGLIESKDELYEYINKKQEALREKYKVDKVYIPNNINIVKDITYISNLDNISDIYNKISSISPFTIKGYTVTIDKTESSTYVSNEEKKRTDEENIIKLNILDKDMFTDSVKNVLFVFVKEDEYDDFMNKVEKTITTTGSYIENIYIEDKITIKENYISTDSDIYMSEEELSKYLIYGNNNITKIYKVKNGETLEDVALKNRMSVNEIAIINKNVKDENTLLYAGQELNVGSISPILNIIVEKHEVEDQVVKFKTKYEFNNKMYLGQQKMLQKGINGLNRVTKKIKYLNGDIYNAFIAGTEELSPMVPQIIEKGGRQTPMGNGDWVWPTNIPYQITSPWAWRWGSFHGAIDISGVGAGSPIYAAHNGTILAIKTESSRGNYVVLDHGDGFYTQYCHMRYSGGKHAALKYIKKGDYVHAGDVIGEVGNTGYSFGNHLDFSVWTCVPWSNGCPASPSTTINPTRFY